MPDRDCYSACVIDLESTAIASDVCTNAIAARLSAVRQRIANAAIRSGRRPEAITLVAVTKTHSLEIVRQAMTAGIHDVGENRVQEAEPKIEAIGHAGLRWHLIGHLQANKARRAVELFDLIQSVDSVSIAQRLDRICGEIGRAKLPVLIQVDLGGEETKTGASEEELPTLVEAVRACARLNLKGLMTLPPFFEDVERVRPYFRRLREIRDDLISRGVLSDECRELSMGMSHDFEVAIEEGATIVRVGTAIFGER
jgi:hypothetical protein